MNCKVCGNAVNYYERTCSVCGNDLEAQRREAAGIDSVAAGPGSFYAPPRQNPTPSLAQEKDQAINRILYDNEGASAHDRLEERRKKRQTEKSYAPHTGFPSFFTQERKEEPPAQTVYQAAPTHMPEPEVEDRPLRRFSNEFIFGNKPEPVPGLVMQDEPVPYVPVQQSFNIPQAPEPSAYMPAYSDYPEPDVYAPPTAPAGDPYFALTPSDEEQAKFNIDKKNEEFQELLDREFEKLKTRENEAMGFQNRVDTGYMPPGLPADSGRKPYIQDRIDEYLRKSEIDMTPDRAPIPDPGYVFDDQNYSRAYSQGGDPNSDYDADRLAYRAAETSPAAGRGSFRSGEASREYTRTEAEPWEGTSYADFEKYDYPPAPATYEPPAPYVPPVPPIREGATSGVTPWGPSRNEAPTRESIAAFIDRPIEFPFDEKSLQGPQAGRDSFTPTFEFDSPAPTFYEPPAPVFNEPPAVFEPPAPAFNEPPAPYVGQGYESAQPFTVFDQPAPEYAAPFTFDDFSGMATGGAEEHGPAAGEESITEKLLSDTGAETAWTGVIVESSEPENTAAGLYSGPGPVVTEALDVPAQEGPAPTEPETRSPDFVDIMTEMSSAAADDEDSDGPPAFYKAYTQGLAVQKVEAADAAMNESAGAQAEPAETIPGFLTAYDKEQLGKAPGEKPAKPAADKKEQKGAKPAAEKKRSPAQKKADARRTALSAVITILIVILVIVVACILVLKFMPGSFGAYYIQDFVELVQSKLGIGGSS